jgi:hypothetical protein
VVSLLQIGGTIVGDQDLSVCIFPDQNLERQIDGNAGRRQHHGSAALWVPENQQLGRAHFHFHLSCLAAVIDQREKRDAFGLQRFPSTSRLFRLPSDYSGCRSVRPRYEASGKSRLFALTFPLTIEIWGSLSILPQSIDELPHQAR